jgi:hypothetical protein
MSESIIDFIERVNQQLRHDAQMIMVALADNAEATRLLREAIERNTTAIERLIDRKAPAPAPGSTKVTPNIEAMISAKPNSGPKAAPTDGKSE